MSKQLKSAYNLLLTATAAVMLAACSDATGVDGGIGASLTVLREQQVQDPQQILPFTPTLEVSVGRVEILGQFRTPTPCYELATELVNASRVLTLQVKARPTNVQGACAQVLVVRDYGAAISRIPAGRYTVRVVHIIEGQGSMPDIVLEQEVDVP